MMKAGFSQMCWKRSSEAGRSPKGRGVDCHAKTKRGQCRSTMGGTREKIGAGEGSNVGYGGRLWRSVLIPTLRRGTSDEENCRRGHAGLLTIQGELCHGSWVGHLDPRAVNPTRCRCGPEAHLPNGMSGKGKAEWERGGRGEEEWRRRDRVDGGGATGTPEEQANQEPEDDGCEGWGEDCKG